MIMKLVGDLHIGKRFPYTTQKTAEKFNNHRRSLLHTCMAGARGFQLGDLFDSYSVQDTVLMEGYQTARKFDRLLAGNHDLAKNTDKPSALVLLSQELKVPIVYEDYLTVTEGMTKFYLVPHKLLQEGFEATLKAALADLQATGKSRFNVLLLHCNYGEHRGPQSDNYLTPKTAKELLDGGFTLIVSGHEHNYRNPMPGVHMLGSLLPLDFGQMEAKYIADYDTQTGELSLVPTWHPHSYAKVPAQEFIDEHSDWGTWQFIEVTGIVDLEGAVKVNRQINHLFKTSDSLVAFKNSVVLHRHEKETEESEKGNWLKLLLESCATEEQREALAALAAKHKPAEIQQEG